MGRPCSNLAKALSSSRFATSRLPRVLRSVGIVAQGISESDARVRMVGLRPQPFSALRHGLDEVEAFWGRQLAAFSSHDEDGGRHR